jgi:ATP-dependent exoDNAse (exonuclease V) beta subunit
MNSLNVSEIISENNTNNNSNILINSNINNIYLSNLNRHERDAAISFDAGPHKYTINGDTNKDYTSVTKWNHSHFSNFDADKIITSMMNSNNWEKNKYYGKTREEIKYLWDKNRDEAADAGTKMHYDIECYYNKNPTSNNDSVEYAYFKEFIKLTETTLIPYRTEWMIYHEDLLLAGSVDMVFINPDGSLMIYDWKRSKEIKKTDNFMKFAKTDCISHIPDTNYWHYALQLNTYKAIIEEKYGKKVTKLCLVCLHPDNKNKSFQLIPVPDLQNEIKELFELRMNELSHL